MLEGNIVLAHAPSRSAVRGAAAMTADDVETFRRCMSVGGVALFPTDTVYGLATEPESKEGVRRLYGLKGRVPDKPAAVMFFDLELALAALPELGPRTAAALWRLLPAAVTVVLPNPARRYPLACGPVPDRLGLRVPRLDGAACSPGGRALARPAVQRQPRRRPRRTPPWRRGTAVADGVDLVLDAGELPGTASTVVDLGAYEDDGDYEVLRVGAVPEDAVAAAL